MEQIIDLLKKRRSVSEIARVLDVSRSSLKDYIESRELKEVVNGIVGIGNDADAEATVIGTIQCPIDESHIRENV